MKTLKLKLRPDEQAKYNSPWNIAVNFNVDLSLSSQEISTMLSNYASKREVKMDIQKVSEKLYFYTSGYPFLVSRLSEIIDVEVMKGDGLFWRTIWDFQGKRRAGSRPQQDI